MNEWVEFIHAHAVSKWWWHPFGSNVAEAIHPAEKLILIQTEIGELVEAERLVGYTPSQKIPEFSLQEEEAADALHRLLDYCGGRGLRVAEALVAKIKYNDTRKDHNPSQRFLPGGKEW